MKLLRPFSWFTFFAVLPFSTTLSAQEAVYMSQGKSAWLIVDVVDEKPSLLIDGKIEPRSMSGEVHVRRVDYYVPAIIHVDNLSARFLTSRPESVNKMLKGFSFRASFEPSAPLDRVYLILSVRTKSGLGQLFFHEIGLIQPGKPKFLSFDHDLAQDFDYDSYEIHLFSHGGEVMNSEMPPGAINAAENRLIAKELKDLSNHPVTPLIAPPPAYPEALRAKKLSGKVVVAFTVGPDGHVHDPKLAEASDPAFGEAALATLQQWRFVPALKDGQRVAAAVRLPFAFSP